MKVMQPKFLTLDVAKKATDIVLSQVFEGPLAEILKPKRQECHVVILVPAKEKTPLHESVVFPLTLHEQSRRRKDERGDLPFEKAFDLVARSKANQLWEERNDGRTDCQPHLLFPDEAPWYGGVKREGIVVACSGLQPWVDQFISGMIADLMITMARSAWEESVEKKSELPLLLH